MTIAENIDNRKAAEALHNAVLEIAQQECQDLPSDASREMFWRKLAASVRKQLPAPPVQEPTKPARPRQPATATVDRDAAAAEALEVAGEIQEMADIVCEEGEEFARSVSDRAAAIAETIERTGTASERQLEALRNMRSGLERWFYE